MNNFYATGGYLLDSSNKGILIAAGMSSLFVFLFLLVISLYFYNFHKTKFKHQFINTKLIYILSGFLLINIIVNVIFWLVGVAIVGDITAKGPIVALLIISFLITGALYIFIFLFLHYIAVGIDDKFIHFIGEKIKITKITKINEDKEIKSIVLYYVEGKRNNKKTKWKINSVGGQFIDKYKKELLVHLDI